MSSSALFHPQLSVPYLAKASASSTTGGSVVNINGPSITVNPGAAMAHKLAQGSMDELTTSLAIDLVRRVNWSFQTPESSILRTCMANFKLQH